MSTKHTAQRGFTLIELMISIVLGLVITAAATRVLITSSQSSAQQDAGSDALNDEAFSLSTLEQSIALANYGANEASTGQDKYVMNPSTPFGGVVLPSNVTTPTPLADRNLPASLNIANAFLTQSANTNSASNFSGQSDQLTLQHAVPASTQPVFDCEGRQVPLPAGYDPVSIFDASVADNRQPRFLVERYFVRADNVRQPNEPNPIGLACAAAVYYFDTSAGAFVFAGSGASDLTSSTGSLLINRVDHFKILLGVNTSNSPSFRPQDNRLQFYTPAEYMAVSGTPKPKIVSIKYAVVTRSVNPVSVEVEQKQFNLLGQNLTLSTDPKYGRQVIEKGIMVRNARGWNS